MSNAEQDKLAKRIQEFRTQSELDSLRSMSHAEASTSSGDGIHLVGINSYKSIEALMQSTANGEVKTIKQGYLLKRSTNIRGDWQRRFFVLDSHGTLYYYGTRWSKQPGKPLDDDIVCRTVDLRTSTIKIDAELIDLRFCFRIISPMKTITLQPKNAGEWTDWIDKIIGVIASLLSSPFVNQSSSERIYIEGKSFGDTNGAASMSEDTNIPGHDNVYRLLRGVPGKIQLWALNKREMIELAQNTAEFVFADNEVKKVVKEICRMLKEDYCKENQDQSRSGCRKIRKLLVSYLK